MNLSFHVTYYRDPTVGHCFQPRYLFFGFEPKKQIRATGSETSKDIQFTEQITFKSNNKMVLIAQAKQT